MAIDKRKIQEVNAGSMADIAFLLLIFFLVATTMNTDSGINRTLPPWSEKQNSQKNSEIHERDLLVVRVNQFDQISVNKEVLGLLQLKDKAKEFLLNPNNDPNMPEKEMRDIDGLGNIEVSKGVISLQNARQTTYDMYIKVQNELTRAINEIRDEVSLKHFKKRFAELDDAQKEAVQKAVPTAISEAEPVSIGGR